MSGPPEVRRARGDELSAVARILCDAFVDEAGLNYWLRQGDRKEEARRSFFEAAVRDVVHPRRDLWVAEGGSNMLGAAVWVGSRLKAYDFGWRQKLALAPLLWRVAGALGAARGLALGGKLDALHPAEPHAHLVFLGVSPHAQGKGLGSMILKHTLALLDASHTPALLEATTERNVTLYSRHGFEVIDNLSLAGLHVRIMWREARD